MYRSRAGTHNLGKAVLQSPLLLILTAVGLAFGVGLVASQTTGSNSYLFDNLTALDSLDFTLHSHAAALFSNNDATKCCCALSVRVLLSDVQLICTAHKQRLHEVELALLRP